MNVTIKTLYHWHTLTLWVVFLFLYTFIPQQVSVGGCSGCLPNEAGELACVNTCPQAIDFLPYEVTSYVLALAVVLIYKTYIKPKKA